MKINQFMTFAIVLVCACQSKQSSKIEYEWPKYKVCSYDIGYLSVDKHGASIEDDNELTLLLELLESDSCDQYEISYTWKSTRGYPDMPKKLIYDKKGNRVLDVYASTGEKETYSNVDLQSISKFLKSNKPIFYLNDYTNDNVNLRGEEPEQNLKSGAVSCVIKYVESLSASKENINFIEWSRVIPEGDYWILRSHSKFKNNLGELIALNAWYYIQNNEVVDVVPIEN